MHLSKLHDLPARRGGLRRLFLAGWPRAVTIISLALYASLALSSFAVISGAYALADRVDSRLVVVSRAEAGTDAYIRPDRESWRGRDIYTVWIEPATAQASKAVPPGVSALPEPGWAAVSPALDSLARENQDLNALFPRRTLIEDSGTVRAAELIAYIRPPLGRLLGGEEDALRVKGGRLTGDSGTVRISGFSERGSLPIFDDEPRAPLPVVALSLLFGLMPALWIFLIGARQGTRRAFPRFDGSRALLPLVGIIIGAAVWMQMARVSDVVPLTTVAAVRGDRWLWFDFGGLAALTALAVPITGLRRFSSRLRPSPTDVPSSGRLSTSLRVLPLAAGALLFVASHIPQLGPSASLLAVACASTALGACLCLPLVLRALGARMSGSSSPVNRSVGMGIMSEPGTFARPYFVLTAAIMLFIFFLPSARSVGGASPSEGRDSVSVATVEWSDVRPGDFGAFRRKLGLGEAIRVATDGDGGDQHEHGHADHQILHLAISCPELAVVFRTDCVAGERMKLPADSERAVARLLGSGLGESVRAVTLVGDDSASESGRVIVVGRAGASAIDVAVRKAARDTLPAAHVESDAFDGSESRSDQVVIGGLAFRILLLVGFVVLLFAIDEILASSAARRNAELTGENLDANLRGLRVARLLAGWLGSGVFGVFVGWLIRVQLPGLGQREAAVAGAWSVGFGLVLGALFGVVCIYAAGPAEVVESADPDLA